MMNMNGTLSRAEKYSPEEKEKIQQFQKRVKDVLLKREKDDDNLVKWLIARNFDLDKAEDMYRKHARFIKVNGLEDILETYEQPEALKYFHSAFLGYDKEGSVVRILHIGGSDLRGITLAASKLDCLKEATYVLLSDHVRQVEERKNDAYCDKHVYIIDLQGLSWSAIIQKMVVDRSITLLKAYEAHHPERLKVCYLVNAPSFFSFIYNWMKTVLPQSIISKLQVLSQDEVQDTLKKTIDLSILPASLGGIRSDPDTDPDCQSLYQKPLGIPLPDHLFSTDHLEVLKNDPEAKRVLVEYKSIFIAEKVVTEPNSSLQWDFQTVDYDIRMGLQYKKDEHSEPIEIMPTHRVDSHIFPESGKFPCGKPGIYELVFDNTYSWMTSKELIFKVNLEPPSNDLMSD